MDKLVYDRNLLTEDQNMALKLMSVNKALALILNKGDGKTITSLTHITDRKAQGIKGRYLVVAPIKVVDTVWKQERSKWKHTQHLKISTLRGKNKEDAFYEDSDIDLINFEGMIWLGTLLRQMAKKKKVRFPYYGLIIDESTALKDGGTKRFKVFKILFKYFQERYLLSADVYGNSFLDVWSQWYVLDQGKRFGTSMSKFRFKYFFQVSDFKWVIKEGAREEICDLVAKDSVRSTNLDPEVPHEVIDLYTTMPLPLFKRYIEFQDSYLYDLTDQDDETFYTVTAANKAVLDIKAKQIVQGAIYRPDPENLRLNKWEYIHDLKIQMLKKLRAQTKENMIVSIWFRFEYEMLEQAFGPLPIIAGGVSSKQTVEHVENWNRGKYPMMLVHPFSVSHGLNLQFGGHVLVWYSLIWSWERYSQTIGRLARRGQAADFVKVYRLMIRYTIDEVMAESVRLKTMDKEFLISRIQTIRQRALDHYRKQP